MAFIFFLIIIQFDRIVSFYVYEHWNRRNKIYIKKNVRVRLKLSLFRRNMYNVIVFVPSIADRLSLVAVKHEKIHNTPDNRNV